MSKKVFVAMSGGVDSSVAAALLKRRGFDVVGAHIKCYNRDGCGGRDAEDARCVAEQLKIPFYVFDLEQEYKNRVVRSMVEEYRAGRTPNPDVMCNKEIKFGLFLKRALELGADYIATGHYVRLQKCTQTSDVLIIKTARDQNKDQSYFLWTLTQEQLKRCLFPIGEYTKPRVRAMAKKFNLFTADKKDSQGICFLGKVTLADFLKEYIPSRRGAILTAAGKKIGEHNGAHFYTIGQRHGFTVTVQDSPRQTPTKARGGFLPHYVVEKNIAENTLVVTTGKNNPELYRTEIKLRDVNVINPLWTSDVKKFNVYARVRYRQPLASARVAAYNVNTIQIIFDKPQKFIAPGQSAVFYNKRGVMLGGGVIV